MNPVIALLHNTTANTWHPILFLEKPLPGPYSPDKPVRHKSHMHHTAGFPSRAEAVKNILDDFVPRVTANFSKPKLFLGSDLAWDGTDVPATVEFFVNGLVPPEEFDPSAPSMGCVPLVEAL